MKRVLSGMTRDSVERATDALFDIKQRHLSEYQ